MIAILCNWHSAESTHRHAVHCCMLPQALDEPQWIKCDIRKFDMSILGKFGVVMADPPWDIHMDLPYGTMKDDEMRNLNIGCLQDEGVLFLWVTSAFREQPYHVLK